ncbi:MAG TPA: SigE family RNA polymerase sigma factor [Micromonosporaceae bacterium]
MTRPAFDEYVATRSGMLLRFAYLLCGDRYLAEDLVQEVLVRAHRRWSAIEAENPDAYLKSALVRAHVSWRRRRPSSEVATATVRDMRALDAFDDAHASRDEVWALLAMLPPKQRAVLVLRYFEDLDDRRIAELVGSSAGAVRVRAHRGLTALRETLAQRADEAPEGAGMAQTVRHGAARAARRRRVATGAGIAAVAVIVAAVAVVVAFLRPPASTAPVEPTPTTPLHTPSPPPGMVSLSLGPPTYPYAFAFVPPGVGSPYITTVEGNARLHYGDGSPEHDRLETGFQSSRPIVLPDTTVQSPTTINGLPATLVTSNSNRPGATIMWQQDGLWFTVFTDGTVSVDDLRRFAESMGPGSTEGTPRNDPIDVVASAIVPAGYVVYLRQIDTVCVRPGDAPSVTEGICIGVSSLDFTITHSGGFTLDGSPAYLQMLAPGGTALVVMRPDGQFVRVAPPVGPDRAIDKTFTTDDLVAFYRGITFRR